MAGIFISHAAADKEIVDTFVDQVVRLGCAVPDELIFYSSGADTGVPSGKDLNSHLRDEARRAGLVIALVTPAFQRSLFCVAELGAAWSRVGKLFPLLDPRLDRSELDGVLTGLVIRKMNDETALDELHERVSETRGKTSKPSTWGAYRAKWLTSSKELFTPPPPPTEELSLPQPTGIRGSNSWGQLFEGFVDAALYTADDSVARQEIIRAVDLKLLIPGRYLYSSDSGADYWVRLCKDASYRHHKESVKYWSSAAGKTMAKAIYNSLGRVDFDYISLGPGDGQKDAALIGHWLGLGADLFYYPYDVSLPLVSQALRTVLRKLGARVNSNLRVKAVLADFEHLGTIDEVFRHRDSPNVVSLLGNSLGNLEGEIEFLDELSQNMGSDDLLVLEVRLKRNDGPLPEQSSPQSLRFDFGPLEHYLGLTFDEEKMSVIRKKDLSSIPNTTTTVVTAKNIDVPGARAKEATLIYIHEYTERDFLEAVKEKFEIVDKKPGSDTERFLVCLLRKRAD